MNSVYLKKHLGTNLKKVPSPNQFCDCESSWRLWFVPKMKILSTSPCTLSNIKNCSLAWDCWYWSGSSGASSLLAGLGSWWLAWLCNRIFLLLWCRAGKLMSAASDIPPSSLPNITWTWSWVSVFLRLIFALTFAISLQRKMGTGIVSRNIILK